MSHMITATCYGIACSLGMTSRVIIIISRISSNTNVLFTVANATNSKENQLTVKSVKWSVSTVYQTYCLHEYSTADYAVMTYVGAPSSAGDGTGSSGTLCFGRASTSARHETATLIWRLGQRCDNVFYWKTRFSDAVFF